MTRTLALIYGVLAYAVFFVVFLYAIGFVENLAVPRSIDAGPAAPVETAVLVNLVLLVLFAVQHSVMARPAFKRWWTRIVPEPIERSTYVLASTLVLALLVWRWRPIPAVVWATSGGLATALVAVSWLGWAVALLSTFLIDHFEMFGLSQVWAHRSGGPGPAPRFRTPWLYGFVRHPLYLGFVLAFFAAPEMTAGHLLFATAMLAYILVAIRLEEHDLIGAFGERYLAYRRRVSMLIPLPPKAG